MRRCRPRRFRRIHAHDSNATGRTSYRAGALEQTSGGFSGQGGESSGHAVLGRGLDGLPVVEFHMENSRRELARGYPRSGSHSAANVPALLMLRLYFFLGL